MSVITKILFISLFLINQINCGNILYISGMASPSHHIYNRAFAFGLEKNGHNITYIGPDQDNVTKPKNYHFILLEGVYDAVNEEYDMNALIDLSPWQLMQLCIEWNQMTCQKMLESKGFETLLNYPVEFKFDLIVLDLTSGYCFLPIIEHFGFPPTIGITPFLLPSYISYNFGNGLFPSYIPWYSFRASTEMSFVERLLNFYYTNMDVLLRNWLHYKQFNKMMTQVTGRTYKSWQELESHISLVLTNIDPVLDVPQPLPPNIIAIGGLHTRKSKEISLEFQKILDEAKNGVILFSLGTNIRSDKLTDNQKSSLLSALGRLQETVIWKFESELDTLPSNVIIRKWLPQNDILSHPNVKLFIGHGGALSTQEAIYHGVPMIAIPFFVDQHINAKMLVMKQLGSSLDIQNFSTDNIYSTIQEVLKNPIYGKNMRLASKRFRDRSETPLDRAVFWAEYVLRHKDVGFLNTPARNMAFWQRTSLDIIAFILLVVLISCYVTMTGVKFLISCYSTSKHKEKIN